MRAAGLPERPPTAELDEEEAFRLKFVRYMRNGLLHDPKAFHEQRTDLEPYDAQAMLQKLIHPEPPLPEDVGTAAVLFKDAARRLMERFPELYFAAMSEEKPFAGYSQRGRVALWGKQPNRAAVLDAARAVEKRAQLRRAGQARFLLRRFTGATALQKVWRGHRSRRRVARLERARIERVVQYRLECKSAGKIERAWVRFRDDVLIPNRSARIIQRNWRVYLVHKRRRLAAECLQRAWRYYVFSHRELTEIDKEVQERVEAVRKEFSYQRQRKFVGILWTKPLDLDEEERLEEHQSAIAQERAWRHFRHLKPGPVYSCPLRESLPPATHEASERVVLQRARAKRLEEMQGVYSSSSSSSFIGGGLGGVGGVAVLGGRGRGRGRGRGGRGRGRGRRRVVPTG